VKRSLFAFLAALALFFAGCGQSDKDKVKSTVQSYIDGLAKKDGKKVCDQLTPSVQTQVKQRSQAKDCATAIDKFEASTTGKAVAPAFQTAKVTSVNVKGGNATASISLKVGTTTTTTTIPLQKVSGNWKILSPGAA
jgi:hypothetical protein